MQTVQNDENGVFTFEPLTYTQDEFKTEEGYAESVERNYTVREVDEGKPGYINHLIARRPLPQFTSSTVDRS